MSFINGFIDEFIKLAQEKVWKALANSGKVSGLPRKYHEGPMFKYKGKKKPKVPTKYHEEVEARRRGSEPTGIHKTERQGIIHDSEGPYGRYLDIAFPKKFPGPGIGMQRGHRGLWRSGWR